MSQVTEGNSVFGQLIGIGIIIVGIIIAILVVSSLDSTIDEPSSSLNLTSNSGFSLVSGYDVFAKSPGNWFGGPNNDTRVVLISEHDSLIRQAGTIKQVVIDIETDGESADLTEIYFDVWRKDGATYDLVGRTQNMVTEFKSIGAGNTGTITLPQSSWISGVVEGDYMGIKVVTTNSISQLFDIQSGDSTVSMYWQDDGVVTLTDVNFDFEAQNTATNQIRMQYKMDPPSIVFIGDSITGGTPAHAGYADIGATANSPTTAVPYKVGQTLGVSIQNMGDGSTGLNNAAAGLARFTEDVVDLNPRAVVIGYGTAEVNSGVAESTFIASMQSMINEAQAAGITPIIYKIYPRDYDTLTVVDPKDTNRLSFNAALETLASNNSITLIDTDSAVGDGLNPLGMNVAYDSGDNIHFNESGHTQIASIASTSISNTSIDNIITDSRRDLIDNASIVFSLASVLVLLLIIPLIRVIMVRN